MSGYGAVFMGEDMAGRPFRLPEPQRNPGEVVRMTEAQMREHWRAGWGQDATRWPFVCPACATVQCVADVDAAGLGPVAREHIGRVCVNAYRAVGDPAWCGWTALTSAGGPLTVVTQTTYGRHERPAMLLPEVPS